MKKLFKIIGIVLLLIVGLLAVGVIVLAVNSPGKLEPLTDAQGREIVGALAEKTFVEIGGKRQGMFIRGENPENPVILFLHGGPGAPALPMIVPAEREERLEKYFTVCYWDERGAGMSFDGDLTAADVTLDRLVEDTREVTEYLLNRFGKEKLILMGHSWGSYLGVKAIHKYPDLYAAWIGIGQVTWQLRSEHLAYDWMEAHATETGDAEALAMLATVDTAAVDFPTNDYLIGVRTPLLGKYGVGMIHKPVSVADQMGQMISFRGYTLGEKIKYVRGSLFSLNNVWPSLMADDLFISARQSEVPVYIAHGKWDRVVSYDLARQWFDVVEAPAKGFFTFDDSAHSPNIEEPEKFVRTVRDIAAAGVSKR